MEKFGWTYITAIFSVIIGWFLNELGQWFRSRKEDKKIVKKVLYNLLETFHIFNQLDTSRFTQLISERLSLRIPEDQRDDFEKEFKSNFPTIINGSIQTDAIDRLKLIESNYTRSVDDLSSVDPIRAFRLNGKTRVLQAFELIQNSSQFLIEKYSDGSKENQQQIQDQINSIFEKLKPKIINEAISDLEKEIVDISFSINIPTWIDSKKTLKKTKNRLRTEGAKRIDEWIDKFEKK